MRSHEQVQAAVSVIVPKGDSRGNDGSQVGGLMGIESIASRSACAIAKCRAMLCLPSRLTGCRLGGLRYLRRLIATSRYARGFSFGVNRAHGLIAPVPYYGLTPCGKPSGLSLPKERSANPRGVSHLLGGWWVTSYSLSLGILAMMRTLSRNVSTAFPSIPEPIFLPVQSRHKRAEERPQVNTFTDVADGAEGLLQRAQAAYREAAFLPSAVARAELRARVSDCLAELIAFCREVESLPAGQNLKEARHG